MGSLGLMTLWLATPTPPSLSTRKETRRMKQNVAVSSKERRRRLGAASDWQWCSARRREKPLRCCCQPHSRSPMRASSTLRRRHQGEGTRPTPTSTDHSTITSSPPEALHLQCSQVLASQHVEWSLMLTSVLCKNLL